MDHFFYIIIFFKMIADHFALQLADVDVTSYRTFAMLNFALQLEHAGGFCAEGAALVA